MSADLQYPICQKSFTVGLLLINYEHDKRDGAGIYKKSLREIGLFSLGKSSQWLDWGLFIPKDSLQERRRKFMYKSMS